LFDERLSVPTSSASTTAAAGRRLETNRVRFRLSTSVGGTLTGRGGDVIVIDDPLKPDDALSESKRTGANQWFANTLLSRLDDKLSVTRAPRAAKRLNNPLPPQLI
jgi:hypothetical protein